MTLGSERRGAWLRVLASIVRNILTHPFILATFAGLIAAYYQYQPPAPVNTLLNTLADAAAPCALFALGISAALRPVTRVPVDLAYLLPMKLVLHPVLVFLAVSWIPDVPDYWVFSAVLLATLPTATNVFVIAQHYQTWEQRASSMVVISTVISVVTIFESP